MYIFTRIYMYTYHIDIYIYVLCAGKDANLYIMDTDTYI